jgi:CheY-like chemotaxis protein
MRRTAAPSTILVVDDERDYVETMAMLLRSCGYDVLTASDGTYALQVLTARPVDVVLTDLAMPGLDGFRLLEAVRLRPQCHHTLVIAVTGWGGRTAPALCASAGFDAYFLKPCDIDDLLWTIGAGLLRAQNRAARPQATTAPPLH